MSGYDDLTELHDFGRVLMHEVRDRAIRELFDRFTGSGDGAPSDESLRHLLSGVDAAAIQDVVVAAVNVAIGGFLYFMDGASSKMGDDGSEFDIFSPSGTSIAVLSHGLDADPYGPRGWISKYSEFPE